MNETSKRLGHTAENIAKYNRCWKQRCWDSNTKFSSYLAFLGPNLWFFPSVSSLVLKNTAVVHTNISPNLKQLVTFQLCIYHRLPLITNTTQHITSVTSEVATSVAVATKTPRNQFNYGNFGDNGRNSLSQQQWLNFFECTSLKNFIDHWKLIENTIVEILKESLALTLLWLCIALYAS